MTSNPALSTDSGAHFDLGVDRLANPVELVDMADPWVGTAGSSVLALQGEPAALPDGDLSPWAAKLHLPGV